MKIRPAEPQLFYADGPKGRHGEAKKSLFSTFQMRLKHEYLKQPTNRVTKLYRTMQCQHPNSDINPLNTKRRPLYLKTQFVPRSKHFISVIKTNQFML